MPDLLEQIETPPRFHYKLAISDYLTKGIEKSRREGNYEQFMQIADSVMDSPAMQYRPLPQATRFHKSTKKFRYCLGGNRSSKTTSAAMEVFYFATGFHPFQKIESPSIGWYATLTWDMVGAVLWPNLESLLAPLIKRNKAKIIWHGGIGTRIPKAVRIKTPRGESQIIFKAYEQKAESFQGTDRRWICADEQMPHDVYIEMITRIGAKYPLSFWSPMTPIKPQQWLQDRLTIDVPENYDVFEFPIDDNRESVGGFIPDSEIDQLINEWPEEVRPTRRNGKWGSFVGAVYKSFSRAIHVVKAADENLFFPNLNFIKHNPTIRSIDFGAADPFVCLWGTKIPHMDNAWYIYDEYYWDSKAKGVQKLLKEHAAIILATDKKWGCGVVRTWADHDRQDRHELHSHGIMTMAAKKDDKLAGIEVVQTALNHSEIAPLKKPMLFFAERCTNCIREISSYRWKDPTLTRNVNDLPVDKEDHTCDGTLYLLNSEAKGASTGAVMSGGNNDRRTMQ